MTSRGSRRRFSKFAAITLIMVACMLGVVRPTRADPMSDAQAAYARGDFVTAARRLARLASAGHAHAQGLLGFMYEHGQGVPQDFVVAATWYTRAAEQGDPAAQYWLGLMYDKGRGVPQDAVLAHKWLILAAARASRHERDAYTRLRDAVATKMSNGQIELAQSLASEWTQNRER